MKKLSTKEWIGVVVALVIVGVFMIFPQILRSLKANDTANATPTPAMDSVDSVTLPQ